MRIKFQISSRKSIFFDTRCRLSWLQLFEIFRPAVRVKVPLTWEPSRARAALLHSYSQLKCCVRGYARPSIK